jgi:hypothetical protein
MKSPPCLAALLVGLAGSCAALLPPPAPAPHADTLRLRVAARGVQLYVCQRSDGEGAAWRFIEPEAALLDDVGEPLRSEGPGPAWQAPDGGRIVGTVVAKVDAPGGDVIAWLLLRDRSAGSAGGPPAVTSLQRIRTEGGTAPSGGCDETTLGQIARVPYTAQYTFFEAHP